MNISIDFLSVNNADAFIVWLKNENNESYVIVIDGGNSKDGDKVINHLEKYIFKNTIQKAPDLIISTHPDRDHINGLIPVINYYKNNIGQVLVHDPALHISRNELDGVKRILESKSTLNKYRLILESLNNLDDFISTVDKYRIKRAEPFKGMSHPDFPISVLGPSEEYYKTLISDFRSIDKYFLENEDDEIYEQILSNEDSDLIIDETNDTTAENNSSVILSINIDSRKYLFTGDAGVSALSNIMKIYDLSNVYWLNVPHHGSRRNLNSAIIDELSPETAYISAKGDQKHPRQALINYLKSKGANVYCTKENNLWHHYGNFPNRVDYSSAKAL